MRRLCLRIGSLLARGQSTNASDSQRSLQRFALSYSNRANVRRNAIRNAILSCLVSLYQLFYAVRIASRAETSSAPYIQQPSRYCSTLCTSIESLQMILLVIPLRYHCLRSAYPSRGRSLSPPFHQPDEAHLIAQYKLMRQSPNGHFWLLLPRIVCARPALSHPSSLPFTPHPLSSLTLYFHRGILHRLFSRC